MNTIRKNDPVRWDDHLHPRKNESNADYWNRQREWFESEAIKIEAWCQGARAALGISKEGAK